MKLLITGGAGFIGSNFIRYMLDKHDYDITIIDKLTYAGRLENLKDLLGKIKFIKGDISNKNLVEKISDIDVIINFAAETHVDRSIIDAGSFVMTDVFGTYILLEAARKFDAKFLQVSTDEVYGSIERGSFKETDKLEPNSPYAASKAGADMLVRSYHITHDVPTLITRSSNNYGPFQYPEKLIPLFITNLLRNKKIPLYGDGMNVRDWIYVTDNCNAIDLVLHKGRIGRIYNVCSRYEKRNIEITKIILSLLDKGEDSIEFVEDRKGHDRRYSTSINKISADLNWRPKFNIDEGLKKTIDWYESNQN